jgi:DNA-binding transcriptional ArsR family regulator
MRDRDYLIAPKVVTVQFNIDPVYNAIEMMHSLGHYEQYPGMSHWFQEVAKVIPGEMMHRHRVVFDSLHGMCCYGMIPNQQWKSYPEYIDAVEKYDPYALREIMVGTLLDESQDPHDGPLTMERPTPEALINDVEVYLQWMHAIWPEYPIDDEIEREGHALLNNPPEMQRVMVAHMQQMWAEVIGPEWERNLPMLQESIAAFRQQDYSGLTALEAIRAVTGRDMQHHWGRKFDNVDHVIFIPSAHIGPYISKYVDGNTLRLVFGARLPKGVHSSSSALSRTELLVRLNALADDTRLRIIELLTQEGELCAQDIIAKLDLSQSSISRHLSQLSATGYITERRRDVSKCYSLNPERINDTMKALKLFLHQKQPAH